MRAPTDHFDDIPQAIQQRLVSLAAAFHYQTDAPIDAITRFMVEVIKVYVDYMEGAEGTP